MLRSHDVLTVHGRLHSHSDRLNTCNGGTWRGGNKVTGMPHRALLHVRDGSHEVARWRGRHDHKDSKKVALANKGK